MLLVFCCSSFGFNVIYVQILKLISVLEMFSELLEKNKTIFAMTRLSNFLRSVTFQNLII